MCEFCTKHGDGRQWYLQMKNYAPELLRAELSADQQAIVHANSRLEWNNRFWEAFIMPAITGVSSQAELLGATTVEEEKVEHFGQVIPLEDVERVLAMADSITRLPCGCRFFSTGKTDQRYCFGLGMDRWDVLGRYPEAAASLEVVDRTSANQIIRKLDDEGLVHTVWTGVTPYVIGICNCDHDCGAYHWSIEERGDPSFFRAEYVCEVNWELCTGCKACMSQCQFGAQFYSHAQKRVYIHPARCYGCGVCRAACPNDAITLVPRAAIPLAADLWV
jgi:ferredoxin